MDYESLEAELSSVLGSRPRTTASIAEVLDRNVRLLGELQAGGKANPLPLSCQVRKLKLLLQLRQERERREHERVSSRGHGSGSAALRQQACRAGAVGGRHGRTTPGSE